MRKVPGAAANFAAPAGLAAAAGVLVGAGAAAGLVAAGAAVLVGAAAGAGADVLVGAAAGAAAGAVGKTASHQLERRYCWCSPTIWPQLGMGGLTPIPMKLSAASAKMSCGIPKVTATTIGVSALGSMWRRTIRKPLAPATRAALTYSFSRRLRICAR